MKKLIWFAPLFALLAAPVHAEDPAVQCHPDAKKFKWHVCIQKPVEYKRGMKTERRIECVSNKEIKVKGCDLGSYAQYIPEGEDPSTVRLYALIPKDYDLREFEMQYDSADPACVLKTTNLDAEGLMKFSDAFDKDNRQRAELVEANLAKKGLELYQVLIPGTTWGNRCDGKVAKMGLVDKKSYTKFLFFIQHTFTPAPAE